MPIEGRFYTNLELQEFLGISKQGVSNISTRQGWTALHPGLYCSEDVEIYLMNRNIDPKNLPIRTHDYPDGVTWAEREEDL